MSETEIQSAVLAYLTLRGHKFWRINSGAFKNDRGGFYRMAPPGFPDLVGCPKVPIGEKSQFTAVEIKTPTGRQSPAQKQMQQDIQAAGGRYLILRSIDDAQKAGL